ncbi:MAG TPA: anaerobic ribonucleoside-triphosphate reductase activating protein [Proteobacteria bacterium]|nr:anaerobic ribonucleoside-triphosphate reductase activating protein [Pseudomonadota bacterium]
MKLGGYEKNSLIDWDGKVATVVFTSGCNFRCPFCHNPELVIEPEEAGRSGLDMIGDFLAYLEQWKHWLEGVVVTGGEPTVHPDLPEFLSEIKRRGLPVKLDSNGSNPVLLEKIIAEGLVDYIAMDIKTVLYPERYRQACGRAVDLKPIRRSISLVMEGGCDYEFRSTVIPGFFDHNEIELITEAIAGARRYVLQQFKPGVCLDPEYNHREPYPDDYLDRLRDRVSGRVESCLIRGEMGVGEKNTI